MLQLALYYAQKWYYNIMYEAAGYCSSSSSVEILLRAASEVVLKMYCSSSSSVEILLRAASKVVLKMLF